MMLSVGLYLIASYSSVIDIKGFNSSLFIEACEKVTKALSAPGAFAAAFSAVFGDVLAGLFTDRPKFIEILQKMCGKDFDYEKISEDARATTGNKYSRIINCAISSASDLSVLTVEDLTILGKLIKPLSATSDKKEVIENFTKLLIRVATTQSDPEVTNLAISLVADLAIVSE